MESKSARAAASAMADPIVTANIYCSRHIDDLLREAVAPLRRALHAETGSDGFLWFYRYGKRGEHLKLRLHGPEARRETWRTEVRQTVSRFLEVIASAPPPDKRISKSALPPLDVEDAGDEDVPDRTMLWTEYRRSPVVVGDPIYVADDHHMALFTRALAAASSFALEEVFPATQSPTYLQQRQTGFLKLIIAGLAATDFAGASWPAYFTYHSDWLVRHLLAQSSLGIDAGALHAELDGLLDKARGAVPALARVMAGQHAEPRALVSPSDPLGAWSTAVRALFEHVKGYRGRPEYKRDPYTDENTFLPLFKLFHACANQLGFRISHEAYMHRLLLEAAVASLGQEGTR